MRTLPRFYDPPVRRFAWPVALLMLLRRSPLWALGVGAVISGHYSGWNLGLAGGFGGMLVALLAIITAPPSWRQAMKRMRSRCS